MAERYRVVRMNEAADVDEEAVIEFWEREGALSRQAAVERVSEVLLVGIDREEGLAGLCTVYLAPCERLRAELWHYRLYVGREHRQSAVGIHLVLGTVAHLGDEFVAGRETRAPGILGVVESGVLKHLNRPESEWQERIGFTFIGENERDDHLRVHYFPGALAPLPG